MEAQIEEEGNNFQRCIGSVRESLLQQVEPNIKQIEDQCRAVFKCIQSISTS
jgi:hypothetical protein